jgi:hypothetical protein
MVDKSVIILKFQKILKKDHTCSYGCILHKKDKIVILKLMNSTNTVDYSKCRIFFLYVAPTIMYFIVRLYIHVEYIHMNV